MKRPHAATPRGARRHRVGPGDEPRLLAARSPLPQIDASCHFSSRFIYANFPIRMGILRFTLGNRPRQRRELHLRKQLCGVVVRILVCFYLFIRLPQGAPALRYSSHANDNTYNG